MISKADAKLVQSLHRRKSRAESGLFLVEGVRVTEAALAAGIDLRFAVVSTDLEDTPRGAQLRRALAGRCTLHEVAPHELARYAATETPQGVLAVARIPEVHVSQMTVPADAVLLVLDAVQDPGNFGTLIRSADAFGAHAVLALTGTVDPWNPKSVRSSAGSSFHVPILQLEPEEAMKWLNERGVVLYAADADGTSIDSVAFRYPCALVVGNEGAGISDTLARAAHETIAIPIRGRAESLNVGVAAGVLLYLMLGAQARAT